MSNKRVAIYFESSEATGGVNRVASMIAVALCDRGYDVHIISRYGGNYGRFCDDSRVKFHQLFKKFHSKYITFPLEILKLKRLIKHERIDTLISAGGIFFAIAQFSKCRHIMWDHVSFWHGNSIQQYFRRLSVRRADVVVTLTKDNRDAFAAIQGCKADVITINNPAKYSVVDQGTERNKSVISLGYLGPQKGFDLLLRAWSLLSSDLKNEWTLQIAGEDEGDKPMLEEIIKEHNLDKVELLGFRKDVDKLLSYSAIYAMSSRWEGMPMVLLEAQSYGLPIVSFDCKTGPAEILTDNCGVLVEAENVEKLSAALSKLMVDEQLRNNMSRNALENVKRFSIDKIIVSWDDLLKAL